MTILNRVEVPTGDDIESEGESRLNVETGNEEEEESLESEIPTVGTNLKNPTSRAEQEREDCGHAVHRNWCVVCVKGRCVFASRFLVFSFHFFSCLDFFIFLFFSCVDFFSFSVLIFFSCG